MKITIYGASDDLVEVDGCKNADEFGSDDFSADLIAPDGSQMCVAVRFGRNGWVLGVGLADEDVPFPSWPVRFREPQGRESTGSVVLEIDAPEGTRMTNIRTER